MPPGTPRKNGIIERMFATLYLQMRVMIYHTGLHGNIETGLWSKCTVTPTKPENIMLNPNKEKLCAREVLWQNTRLHKILKEFWRNVSCTQYHYNKIQAIRSRNDKHIPRLCEKPYWHHRWEFTVLHYHKSMIIYPYPFWW